MSIYINQKNVELLHDESENIIIKEEPLNSTINDDYYKYQSSVKMEDLGEEISSQQLSETTIDGALMAGISIKLEGEINEFSNSIVNEPLRMNEKTSVNSVENQISLTELIDNTDIVNANQNKIQYKCPICSKMLSSRYSLRSHYENHFEILKLSCKVCYELFAEETALKNHLRQHYELELIGIGVTNNFVKPIKYQTNNETKIQKNAKEREISNASKNKNESLYCAICDAKYSNRSIFEAHYKSHSVPIIYTCDLCDEWFQNLNHFFIHYQTHNPRQNNTENPFKCHICNEVFPFNHTLLTHMRAEHQHKGAKIYQCEVCHESFRNLAKLIIHSKIHTGKVQYTCKTCFKPYNSFVALEIHYRSHAANMSHTCAICKQNFPTSRSLNVHYLKHEDNPNSTENSNTENTKIKTKAKMQKGAVELTLEERRIVLYCSDFSRFDKFKNRSKVMMQKIKDSELPIEKKQLTHATLYSFVPIMHQFLSIKEIKLIREKAFADAEKEYRQQCLKLIEEDLEIKDSSAQLSSDLERDDLSAQISSNLMIEELSAPNSSNNQNSEQLLAQKCSDYLKSDDWSPQKSSNNLKCDDLSAPKSSNLIIEELSAQKTSINLENEDLSAQKSSDLKIIDVASCFEDLSEGISSNNQKSEDLPAQKSSDLKISDIASSEDLSEQKSSNELNGEDLSTQKSSDLKISDVASCSDTNNLNFHTPLNDSKSKWSMEEKKILFYCFEYSKFSKWKRERSEIVKEKLMESYLNDKKKKTKISTLQRIVSRSFIRSEEVQKIRDQALSDAEKVFRQQQQQEETTEDVFDKDSPMDEKSTIEQEYKCLYCTESFGNNFSLYRHNLVHVKVNLTEIMPSIEPQVDTERKQEPREINERLVSSNGSNEIKESSEQLEEKFPVYNEDEPMEMNEELLSDEFEDVTVKEEGLNTSLNELETELPISNKENSLILSDKEEELNSSSNETEKELTISNKDKSITSSNKCLESRKSTLTSKKLFNSEVCIETFNEAQSFQHHCSSQNHKLKYQNINEKQFVNHQDKHKRNENGEETLLERETDLVIKDNRISNSKSADKVSIKDGIECQAETNANHKPVKTNKPVIRTSLQKTDLVNKCNKVPNSVSALDSIENYSDVNYKNKIVKKDKPVLRKSLRKIQRAKESNKITNSKLSVKISAKDGIKVHSNIKYKAGKTNKSVIRTFLQKTDLVNKDTSNSGVSTAISTKDGIENQTDTNVNHKSNKNNKITNSESVATISVKDGAQTQADTTVNCIPVPTHWKWQCRKSQSIWSYEEKKILLYCLEYSKFSKWAEKQDEVMQQKILVADLDAEKKKIKFETLKKFAEGIFVSAEELKKIRKDAHGEVERVSQQQGGELVKDNCKMGKDNREMGKDNSEMGKNNSEMREENNEMGKENNEMRKENNEMGKENGEMGKDNSEMEKDNSNMEIDNHTMEIDEPEFKCGYCTERFNDGFSLYRHNLVHLKVKLTKTDKHNSFTFQNKEEIHSNLVHNSKEIQIENVFESSDTNTENNFQYSEPMRTDDNSEINNIDDAFKQPPHTSQINEAKHTDERTFEEEILNVNNGINGTIRSLNDFETSVTMNANEPSNTSENNSYNSTSEPNVTITTYEKDRFETNNEVIETSATNSTTAALEYHKITNSNESVAETTITTPNTEIIKITRQEKQEIQNTRLRKFKCNVCTKSFPIFEALSEHLKKAHTEHFNFISIKIS